MRCRVCLKEKLPTKENFVLQNSGILWDRCRECHRAWQKKRYAEQNPAAVFKPPPTAPLNFQCSHCWETKSFDHKNFGKNKSARFGLSTICRACNTKAVIRYKYGIEKEIKTEDSCEICGTKHKLVFDHNHRTGALRGIICQHCNTMLGPIEMPARRAALKNYLIKYDSWLE